MEKSEKDQSVITQGTNKVGRTKWLLPAAFVIVGILGFNFAFFMAESTSNPVFSSLVSAPDTSLDGTVAYYDNPSRCVRVISASGAKSKEVMCMPELDALVALLYGLDESQVKHIFETFHRGWDYKPRLEAVLKHFHTWKDKQ